MTKYYSTNKYFLLLLIMISALFLQGCITATVVGSALLATKTAIDPRSLGTQIDDSTLESHVFNLIDKNQQLTTKARIIVTVYQGDILLTGQALSSDLIIYAKNIAMNIRGRNEVYSEIRTGKPVSFITISKDSWITTKIRLKFFMSDIVQFPNVKIITEDGEVFLLGLVTQNEGQEAAKIASQVSGVKHVITAFNILK